MFVPLQLYKQTSLKDSKNHKLAPNFYGSYQLRKLVGQVAYALDIPNRGKIHDIFHMPCLKKKLGSPTHIQTKLTMLDDEGKLVLGSRMMNTLSTEVTNQIMKLHGRINIFVSATHLTNT